MLFALMIAFLTWTDTGDRSRALANEVVEEDELIYDEEEFDQMMLKYKTVEETKQKLSQFLSKEIEVIDKFCSLTETQKRKLLLAGRGDIQWYFDYLSEIRGRYVNRPLSQDEYQTLIQESGARMACMSLAVFGEVSMLRKVLAKTLSEQQLTRYQKLERERHRTLIDGFVRTWEWKNKEPNPIAPSQREKVIELLAGKTQMPPQSTENMVTSVLLVGQTRQFSDDEVKPLLNEEQWRHFQRRLQEASAFERFLLRRGEWPIRKLVDDASESTDLKKE